MMKARRCYKQTVDNDVKQIGMDLCVAGTM